MKIAHIHLSDEFAGSEQYAASLAALQVKAGHTVCVVVRETPHVVRWRAEAAPATVMTVPAWVPSAFERWVLQRMLSGVAPDMIHAHLGGANLKGGRAAKALGVPWVATIHLRYKPKEMAGADGLICIAGWQERDVEMDGYTGQVQTIWNWLPHAGEVGDAHTLRARYKIADQTLVFASAGRLHRQKGMDILIPAFRKAFFDDEDVCLLIAGQGEERLKLQGLAGNDKRIVFAGYQETMPPFYATADVYVSASRYEPFGLTLLEAMAHHLPLVCTQTEGPQEFLAEQTDVLWAKPKHVESLAKALYTAYTQGRRTVQYDMTAFAPETAVEKILAFYETVKDAYNKR